MTFAPGLQLGPYEILGPIGEGGMGEVYRARDTRLNRKVAIKVLQPKYAMLPDYVMRFEREARATAALSHPNILAVHDVGMHEGSPYLVEELLEGESLKARLARGAIPLGETIEMALQIARGLEAAHERGIIHRDLKPANVFITSRGNIVKILDFGLAKLMDFVLPSDATTLSDTPTRSTETGHVLGTAGYMSPEQVRGRQIDHRSDIFSFGCVLYEMVTGQRTFRGENAVSIMSAILERDPQPPREIAKRIPPELERTILKCLEKEPSQRFQSATELRHKLESEEVGAPVSALGALIAKLSSGIRKLKWIAWSLLALLALLTVYVAFYSRRQNQHPPIPEQKNLVVLPFEDLGGGSDKTYCDGMTETVTTKLAGIRGLQVLPVSLVKKLSNYTPEEARRELGANLVLRATWQHAGPQVRINMNLLNSGTRRILRGASITALYSNPFGLQDQVFDKAVQMLDVALQESEKLELGNYGTEYPSAYDYYLRGLGYLQDYTKLSNIQSAISIFRQALQEDSKYALAFAGLGQAYCHGYQLTHESKMLEDAHSACRQSLDLDSSLANGHACLGVVYSEKGEYENAAAELERALRINPNADDSLRGLASAYQKLGKIDEAERTFKNAIAIRRQYWANYSYLGAFYYSRGRYGEAAGMFEQAVKLAPDSFRGYSNLGGTFVAMDRFDEAIPILKRSIEIYPSAGAYNNLGAAYMSRRQFTEAARELEHAVKLQERFEAWSNLGEALFFIQGRRPESVKPFKEAIRLAQARLKDSPHDRNALSSMAYFEAMTSDRKAAQRWLNQAMAEGTNEPAHLIRLAKASSQFGDDKQTLALVKKLFEAGGPPSMITDSPHFDDLRARNSGLRELLINTQTNIQKGVTQ